MKTISLYNAQSSQKYHPYFIDAIMSSKMATKTNQSRLVNNSCQIPVIDFTTDSDTRISMTLNGMRMAAEFFAHDSMRVLKLIEQRLQAGQRDVVHDVLVYLWERVLLTRTNAREAKNLQAESLAAYLGLETKPVADLFAEMPLSAIHITKRIENNEAGTVQRELNILTLVENLLARLQPELETFAHNEKRILLLIEEIATRLYADEN